MKKYANTVGRKKCIGLLHNVHLEISHKIIITNNLSANHNKAISITYLTAFTIHLLSFTLTHLNHPEPCKAHMANNMCVFDSLTTYGTIQIFD